MRTLAERVLLYGGFAVLFFVLPHELDGSDDATRFNEITALGHGHLSSHRFSLIMPIASAPFLALGKVVESPLWWAVRFNVIVAAVAAFVAWRLLRPRLEASTLRRALLILLFASLLTDRLRSYDVEVFAAACIAVGIVCVVVDRAAVAGWIAIAIGAATTPALVVAIVPFAAAEALRRRRLRVFGWVALAAAIVLLEDWVRRGNPFDAGYGNDHGVHTLLPYSGKPGFSYPFLLGVASILFSFGRGLLFFTPGLVLAFERRARELVVPLLLVVAGAVLVYAKWWAWYGGIAWGPRFFTLAAVPASLLIALRIERGGAALLTLVVLALSAWVGFAGATSDHSQFPVCWHDHYRLESLCWYEPTHSSLWWPVLHPPHFGWRQDVLAVWCAAVFVALALPLVRRLPRPNASLLRGWSF